MRITPRQSLSSALASFRRCGHCQPRIGLRTHMNHGGGDHVPRPPLVSGPREAAVTMGLAATQHTSNILRLLESSHGSSFYNTVDTLSTAWHPKSLIWQYDEENDIGWKASSPFELFKNESPRKITPSATPRLCSLHFSDDRMALLKVVGTDYQHRYLQLLRLDPDGMGGGMLPHDGWSILREVRIATNEVENSKHSVGTALASVNQAVELYLEIEHGGGDQDKCRAQQLFNPDSSLLSVGIDPIEAQPATDWSAPVGNLLEIPLETYLDGVKLQPPHENGSRIHDTICSIDCSGNAAAAIVRVGNGAQTRIFEDNLLLGRKCESDEWKILSKTFSPQAWKKI